MAERTIVRLQICRSPGVREFAQFLGDLEQAYLAFYFLPFERVNLRARHAWPIERDLWEYDVLRQWLLSRAEDFDREVSPEDTLDLSRISIQSPGWAEIVGALNPLQQLREYLKDRHERTKDRDWRGDAEKEKARLENEMLRAKVERERVGAFKEILDAMEKLGIPPHEQQRLLWEKLGLPLSRLGRHQDSGLLGAPEDLDRSS